MLEAVFEDQKGDYRILTLGFNDLNINFHNKPYRFSSKLEAEIVRLKEEMERENEEKRRRGKPITSTDDALARVDPESIELIDGILCLALQRTSYFPFKLTRTNIEDLSQNAYPMSVKGITVSISNKIPYIWIGVKDPKKVDFGGGQKDTIPGGYVNPDADTAFVDTVVRELHEELLTYRPDGQKRTIQETAQKIISMKPFSLIDRVSVGNPVIVYEVILDTSNKEVQDSFNACPEENREFTTIESVRFDKRTLEKFLEKNFDVLRPHARGAIKSAIKCFPKLNYLVEEAYKKAEK